MFVAYLKPRVLVLEVVGAGSRNKVEYSLATPILVLLVGSLNGEFVTAKSDGFAFPPGGGRGSGSDRGRGCSGDRGRRGGSDRGGRSDRGKGGRGKGDRTRLRCPSSHPFQKPRIRSIFTGYFERDEHTPLCECRAERHTASDNSQDDSDTLLSVQPR